MSLARNLVSVLFIVGCADGTSSVHSPDPPRAAEEGTGRSSPRVPWGASSPKRSSTWWRMASTKRLHSGLSFVACIAGR